MRNIKKLLGNRIRELRKARKLTQEQLAELVGIGTPNISYIETGRFAPSADTLEKLADVLQVPPYEFYNFEHLKSNDELKQELFHALENDDKLLKIIYKIYNAIK